MQHKRALQIILHTVRLTVMHIKVVKKYDNLSFPKFGKFPRLPKQYTTFGNGIPEQKKLCFTLKTIYYSNLLNLTKSLTVH